MSNRNRIHLEGTLGQRITGLDDENNVHYGLVIDDGTGDGTVTVTVCFSKWFLMDSITRNLHTGDRISVNGKPYFYRSPVTETGRMSVLVMEVKLEEKMAV